MLGWDPSSAITGLIRHEFANQVRSDGLCWTSSSAERQVTNLNVTTCDSARHDDREIFHFSQLKKEIFFL